MGLRDTVEENLKEVRTEPTRQFKVGDKVKFGALSNPRIKEVHEGGKVYTLLYDNIANLGSKYHDPIYDLEMIVPWHNVFPEEAGTGYSDFYGLFPRTLNVGRFTQGNLDSLIFRFYHVGIDMNPPYQRKLVWKEKDKQDLIDSVFRGRDIGKFAFRKNADICHDPYLEVVDGKQRITALIEFYEGRFKYSGYYYHEMSKRDIGHFNTFSIQWAEAELTDEEVLEFFLLLNFAGVPQSKKHLAKIEKMLEDMDGKT